MSDERKDCPRPCSKPSCRYYRQQLVDYDPAGSTYEYWCEWPHAGCVDEAADVITQLTKAVRELQNGLFAIRKQAELGRDCSLRPEISEYAGIVKKIDSIISETDKCIYSS